MHFKVSPEEFGYRNVRLPGGWRHLTNPYEREVAEPPSWHPLPDDDP